MCVLRIGAKRELSVERVLHIGAVVRVLHIGAMEARELEERGHDGMLLTGPPGCPGGLGHGLMTLRSRVRSRAV